MPEHPMTPMPKAVSDAIRVIADHGYLARLHRKEMIDDRQLACGGEGFERHLVDELGRDIGRLIVRDREYLLAERTERDPRYYGVEMRTMNLFIIRAKPDLATDQRLWEETLREQPGFES